MGAWEGLTLSIPHRSQPDTYFTVNQHPVRVRPEQTYFGSYRLKMEKTLSDISLYRDPFILTKMRSGHSFLAMKPDSTQSHVK